MKTKKKQIEYDIILIFRRKTKTIENMKNSFILIYLYSCLFMASNITQYTADLFIFLF